MNIESSVKRDDSVVHEFIFAARVTFAQRVNFARSHFVSNVWLVYVMSLTKTKQPLTKGYTIVLNRV